MWGNEHISVTRRNDVYKKFSAIQQRIRRNHERRLITVFIGPVEY